jgi:hypothetical protein
MIDLNKKLSGLRFISLLAALSILLISITVFINTKIDIYGLFTPVKGRSISILNNERVSKYLLSYHYIPENFNSVIIGTSLSDNLDVSVFDNGDFKIYNASIMGANISEINPIAKNVIKGGIKNVILCISPYLTKNSGSKEVEFGQKVYLGALGSVDLYQTYAVGLIRHYNLLPRKFPLGQFNNHGVHFYNDFFKLDNVQEKINEEIKLHANEDIVIDSVALTQFKELISLLDENHINSIGYFHPVPSEIYESNRANYERFEETITNIIDGRMRLINFNSLSNRSFTSDYTNYIDHGHLSIKGQQVILDSLYKSLGAKAVTN